MTNLIQNRKLQAIRYFKAVIDLQLKNGIVDDYDIRKCTGEEFEAIANLKMPLLHFADHVLKVFEPSEIRIDERNLHISLFDELGVEFDKFSFVLTPQLSFSGTIGINQIEYDCGVSKHLEYLSIFFPSNELYRLQNYHIPFTVTEDVDILDEYVEFYGLLADYLNNSPMALYNLLTGIKKHYGLLDKAVLLTTDSFQVLDFTKFKNIDFINNHDEVEVEASDTAPLLKISYQGSKLLHLRTKSDRKNSKFKLRFFIETSSKFLDLFKEGQ